MAESNSEALLMEIRDLLKEQNRFIAEMKQMNEEQARQAAAVLSQSSSAFSNGDAALVASAKRSAISNWIVLGFAVICMIFLFVEVMPLLHHVKR
jgi:t-SNARE complex subunit (syntaxin)